MPQKNKIPSPFFNAAPVTVEKARKLRKRMTPAEEKLWPFLRNRKFMGLKFRRQHPIDKYIVDYICIEKKLVVEIDGGIHQKPEQKEYDSERTADLERYGLKMLRLSNEDVLNDVIKVLKEIKKYV
jgi:very-short-patch-repair endonuclease